MLNMDRQLAATKKRYDESRPDREAHIKLIREKRPFLADSKQRVHRWFQRRGYSTDVAEIAATTGAIPGDLSEIMAPVQGDVSFERVLGTADFLGVAFLEQALRVARTVCRISVGGQAGSPSGYGTGFMVAPRLMLTNNHVLSSGTEASASVAEFDYYVRADGVPASVRVFSLEPQTFFHTDTELDFTLVAVAELGTSRVPLAQYGWNQLIADEGKAVVGQWVNIIQHPNGEPKQLVLRNNEIVDVLDNFAHYVADTSPGSSGSPVFNDRWEVIALHHSGVPARDKSKNILDINGNIWRPEQGEHRVRWLANEGARLSRILARVQASALSSVQKAMVRDGMQQAPRSGRPDESATRTGLPTGGGEGPTAEVAADGTATWTIPLRVSVSLGAGVQASADARQNAAPVSATVVDSTPVVAAVPTDERTLLEAAKQEFSRRSDVLSVRMGYRFENGWITDDRAIVVTVNDKRSIAQLRREGVAALPQNYMGYPLQVTGPTIFQMIGAENRSALMQLREALNVRAEEIKYQPPLDAPLTRVHETMTARFSVSPDAGWPELSRFIAAARQKLVIGMYDFGAEHIVAAIESRKKATFKELVLTLQKGQSVGKGTKKNDLTDEEVVDRLKKKFGKKFELGWIKIGIKNGWIASSYHIKVAVRDGQQFWLSSGNWQSSNQPEEDLAGKGSKDFSFLKDYNREWHAVVTHKGLAETFERYLRHDFEKGTTVALEERVLALPDLVLPPLDWAVEAAAKFRYFDPLIVTGRKLAVTPVLTPDNYLDVLIGLVSGAKREILIQNQTFNAPNANQAKLSQLMDVLQRKQEKIPVRIIFRVLHQATARENLEGLKDLGFDLKQIRVQPNAHTKGVIVDGEQVLLGSQNISEHGISINRDASLLVDDKEVATYFRELFEHDWESLAKQKIGGMARLPREDETIDSGSAGMVLTPKDLVEML